MDGKMNYLAGEVIEDVRVWWNGDGAGREMMMVVGGKRERRGNCSEGKGGMSDMLSMGRPGCMGKWIGFEALGGGCSVQRHRGGRGGRPRRRWLPSGRGGDLGAHGALHAAPHQASHFTWTAQPGSYGAAIEETAATHHSA